MSEVAHIEKRLDSYDSRFAGIEQALRDIPKLISEASQDAVKSAVTQAVAQVGARRSADVSVNKMSNGNQIWQMSLIFTVLFSMGAFFQQQIVSSQKFYDKQADGIKLMIAEINSEAKVHATIDGHLEALRLHAESKSKISDLTKAEEKTNKRLGEEITSLDSNLQREMRDLNNSIGLEIKNLDKTLQREMELTEKLMIARLDPILTKLNAAEIDLASRKGHRFNMPDYHRLIEPRLKDIKDIITDHKKEHGIKRQENFFKDSREGDAISRHDERIKSLIQERPRGGGS